MQDTISIVIPAYKSSQSLPILIHRLEDILESSEECYEIIVVDDCSPDNTWETLKTLKASHHRLRIVRLLKNSGQHNALLCGFSIAEGTILVTMDDDLQNPPEEVPKLIKVIKEGYDLAIGSYDSKKHSAGRNLGGKLVDDVLRRIFNLSKDFQLTSFRAARKVVIDNVVAMGGAFPYVTAMLLSHTGRYANVPVRHEPRQFGRSNYSLKRSVVLALNLLLSYSSYPLYAVITLCLSALGFAAGLGILMTCRAFVYGSSVPGWASIIVSIAFFNALILLALAIHGLYLSRLSQQVTRSRVSFTIGELHG